jgi:capsular exopolysaccharide synthesis family protein
VDLRSQLAVIAARYRLLVAGIVVAAAVAVGVTAVMPRVYDAQATLLVGQSLSASNPDYNQLLVSENLTATYLQLATSRPVLEAAGQSLGLAEGPDQLATQVSAEQPQSTSLITITAQASTADGAAALADAVAKALIAQSPSSQQYDSQVVQYLAQDLAATRAQIESIQADVTRLLAINPRSDTEDTQLQHEQDQLVSLRATYATMLTASNASAANILTVVGPASVPTSPASPKPVLNIGLGAGLGLLISLAVIFMLDYLDDSVRTVREVRELTGVPTVGTVSRIPHGRGAAKSSIIATVQAPRSRAAESFRSLRTNLMSTAEDRTLHVILVTSSSPGEGKTVVASNLAVAFAQADRQTVLVDADLRKPDIERLLQLPPGPGLGDLLRVPALPLTRALVRGSQANLSVLRAGALPPNPAELLASPRMKAILDEMRGVADIIVIDSSPLRHVTDAAILAGLADGVLLVVEHGKTSRSSLRAGRQALAAVGASVVGAIVNRAPGESAYDDYYMPSGIPPQRDGTVPGQAPASGADA